MKRKLLPLCFASALAFVFLPAISSALTVGPAKIEYSLDPGSTVTGTLFVMNEGDAAQTFYPSFEKFTEQNGEKQFLPGEPADLTSWFGLMRSVTLGPGESKNIPFTLNVPRDASPGGHFAVIWWGTAPPNEGGGQGASIVTRVGIVVYLNVSGQIRESATIDNFTAAAGAKFFSWIPTDFRIVFENTGNVYLKPSGEIRVKNIFGVTNAVFSVNKYGAEILPQSKKAIAATPESVGWGGFGFGIYRADLSLVYGENGGKQVSSRIWFVVITWQIIIPIILLLLLIYWAATKGVKKYNQRVIEKYMKIGNKG